MDTPTVPRVGLNPSALVGIRLGIAVRIVKVGASRLDALAIAADLNLDRARTGRFAARVVAHVRPPGRVDVEMDIVLRRGGADAAQGATDGGCDSGSHASSLCSLTCGSRMLRTG